MSAGEIAENAHALAVTIAGAINPLKTLTDSAQAFLEIKDAATKLAKSVSVMTSLGRAMDVEVPKVAEIRTRIASRKEGMVELANEMQRILTGT